MILQYIISLLVLTAHCFEDECHVACMGDADGKFLNDCSGSEGDVCWICQTYICPPLLPTDQEKIQDRSQDSDVVECDRLDKNLEIVSCFFDSMEYLTCDVRCKPGYAPLAHLGDRNSVPAETQKHQTSFKIKCSVQSGSKGNDDERICAPKLSTYNVLSSSQKRALSSAACSKACMRNLQGGYIDTACKRSWAAAAQCFLCRQRWCNSAKVLVGK